MCVCACTSEDVSRTVSPSGPYYSRLGEGRPGSDLSLVAAYEGRACLDTWFIANRDAALKGEAEHRAQMRKSTLNAFKSHMF